MLLLRARDENRFFNCFSGSKVINFAALNSCTDARVVVQLKAEIRGSFRGRLNFINLSLYKLFLSQQKTSEKSLGRFTRATSLKSCVRYCKQAIGKTQFRSRVAAESRGLRLRIFINPSLGMKRNFIREQWAEGHDRRYFISSVGK